MRRQHVEITTHIGCSINCPLCCMDFALKTKLGNIFKDKYEDIPRIISHAICKNCEAASNINYAKCVRKLYELLKR